MCFNLRRYDERPRLRIVRVVVTSVGKTRDQGMIRVVVVVLLSLKNAFEYFLRLVHIRTYKADGVSILVVVATFFFHSHFFEEF